MRRVARWLAAALAAGIVASLIVFASNTAHPHHPATRAGAPQDSSKPPPTVALDPAARRVAGKYIVSAMTRRNLPLAWRLTHPALRAGYTYRRWLTGNIPVQYFPARALDGASFKIDESHPRRALLEVYIFATPRSGIRSQDFYIGLRKAHGAWLVDYLAPHDVNIVPSTG